MLRGETYNSRDPELLALAHRARALLARYATIGDRAWIGAGTIILPGVTIGADTTIGAGSVVTSDIPPNTLAFGNPCRVQREL